MDNNTDHSITRIPINSRVSYYSIQNYEVRLPYFTTQERQFYKHSYESNINRFLY